MTRSIDEIFRQRLNALAQAFDQPRRERLVDQRSQSGVIRRIQASMLNWSGLINGAMNRSNGTRC